MTGQLFREKTTSVSNNKQQPMIKLRTAIVKTSYKLSTVQALCSHMRNNKASINRKGWRDEKTHEELMQSETIISTWLNWQPMSITPDTNFSPADVSLTTAGYAKATTPKRHVYVSLNSPVYFRTAILAAECWLRVRQRTRRRHAIMLGSRLVCILPNFFALFVFVTCAI